MKVVRSLEEFARVGSGAKIVLAIGAFDGLHLGHASVISRARDLAGADGELWLTSFAPHPMQVLAPDQFPGRLTTDAQRIRMAGELDIPPDGCFLIPFDRDVASWSAEDFVERLCAAVPGLQAVIVGENWRFGRGAEGDVDLIRSMGRERGFSVESVPLLGASGERVSSTRIRLAVNAGKMREAADLLGRSYTLAGTVVHGKKEGREIGFPTANVQCREQIIPPPGIYAAWSELAGVRLGGAGYVSVEGREHGIFEIHFFDVPEGFDVYGEALEVRVLERIRGDRKFEVFDELVAQIGRDVETARRIFEGNALV